MDCVCPVAGPAELQRFSHVFEASSQKKLLDGHLWFSVATKHPRSPFLRIERLTCVLAILFTAMMANILLFTYRNTSDVNDAQPLVKIGPIRVTGFAVTMGIIAALITLPVNMFVVLCFSGRRPRTPSHQPPIDQTTDRYLTITDKPAAAPVIETADESVEEENDVSEEKGWRYAFLSSNETSSVEQLIAYLLHEQILSCLFGRGRQ